METSDARSRGDVTTIVGMAMCVGLARPSEDLSEDSGSVSSNVLAEVVLIWTVRRQRVKEIIAAATCRILGAYFMGVLEAIETLSSPRSIDNRDVLTGEMKAIMIDARGVLPNELQIGIFGNPLHVFISDSILAMNFHHFRSTPDFLAVDPYS